MPSAPSTERRSTQWGFVGKQVIDKAKKQEEKVHKRRCYRKHEYQDLPSYQKLQNSGRMRLESFERAMRFYFEHSDMKLGYMQKRLIDVFIVAALRKFFEHDLVANLKYLSHKYSVSVLSDAIGVLFPRRSGKTEGSAFFIAVTAVSQPKWNAIMYVVFSLSFSDF